MGERIATVVPNKRTLVEQPKYDSVSIVMMKVLKEHPQYQGTLYYLARLKENSKTIERRLSESSEDKNRKDLYTLRSKVLNWLLRI